MTTITVRRIEKTVRAADGTVRKLVSYDGETWQMDKMAARRRVTSATNLHGRKFEKKLKKKFVAYTNPGTQEVPDPVILPVDYHGTPLIGKDKGKKGRRNMRRKKEQNVVQRAMVPGFAGIGMVPKPIHKHRCHGRMFVCSCDTPYLKRKCGGSVCLRDE